jgi:hypothetical protein
MVDLLVLCLGWWHVQRIAKEVRFVQNKNRGIAQNISGGEEDSKADRDFTCGEIYESLPPVRMRGFSPTQTAHP